MLSAIAAIVARDLKLVWRRPGEAGTVIAFFAMVAVLFPLATSPAESTLRAAGPAIVWIAALLASLLPLGTLFRADLDDGTLENMVFSPVPLAWLMVGRGLAHWLATGLPLAILAPVLATSFALPWSAMPTLFVSLLLGTPTLGLLGAIGAALSAGTRQAGSLAALLVLPLQIPVLIFGARTTYLVLDGLDPGGAITLLASVLLLTVSLSPFAIAVAVRISVEQG